MISIHPASVAACMSGNRAGKVVVADDPYADKVSLLMPMQSGTLVDYSRLGRKPLLNGSNITFNSVTGPFNDGYAQFGSGSYCLVDLNLTAGSTDFTIEFWANGTMSQWSGVAAFNCLFNNSMNLFTLYGQQVSTSMNGSSWLSAMTAQFTQFNNGLWHHVCFERSGTTLTFYIDGAIIFQTTISGSFSTVGTYAVLGKKADDLVAATVVQMAHLRVTDGVARYAGAAFVRPSAAFPAVLRSIAELHTLRRRTVVAAVPAFQTLRRYVVMG